jgi:hypothetical protein
MEPWNNFGVNDSALFFDENVLAIPSERVRLQRARLRIDDPVLANAGRLILQEFLATVDRLSPRGDDLDDQVGRTLQMVILYLFASRIADVDDVW